METPVRAEVLRIRVPSSDPSGPGLCPVAWAATRRPRSRASATTAATSRSLDGNAIASGCWSIRRLKVPRAASQSCVAGADDAAEVLAGDGDGHGRVLPIDVQ